MKEKSTLDRIRIDQSHFMDLINPVNPLDIYENVQFFRFDPNHPGDLDQTGTALGHRLIKSEPYSQ